ncbi:MAG: phosphoribosylamine--glycine ligase [Nonlabens sp.]
MNVLILGSGGREHAMALSFSKSPLLDGLYIAPGNAGTSILGTNLSLSPTDFEAIANSCIANQIGMIVVGPEAPLVEGIYDYFQQSRLSHINVVGPSKQGAILEGSKEFAKEFMQRHHIPTAAYQSFTSSKLEDGKEFLATLTAPYVLKADGLAGGKGVLIIESLIEAQNALEEMLLGGKFGEASNKVVIEEFLDGIEMSVFVLTDGNSYKVLPTAKDYKRIGEGDTGLNTGGMGAVSPVPFAHDQLMEKIERQIIVPTVNGLKKDKITYKGFVFIGLMIVNNNPFVIEYNVRMGDPETEVVLPRIKSDLLAHLHSFPNAALELEHLDIESHSAATVMCVAGGYPEKYDKGMKITGLDNITDSIVFHAGTIIKGQDVLTNGGRVLAVTSLGNDHSKAIKKSYQNIEKIHFDRMYYRTDIGFDL